MRKGYTWILVAWFLLAVSAFPVMAETGALIYSRDVLYIHAAKPSPHPADKKADEEKISEETGKEAGAAAAPAEMVRYPFNVQIRPLSAVQIDWFQNLSPLKPDEGIVLTLEETQTAFENWADVQIEVDLCILRRTGIIHTIIPNVVPVTMQGDLSVPQDVAAILYLRAGTTKVLGIAPGSRVEHTLFTPGPRILREAGPQ